MKTNAKKLTAVLLGACLLVPILSVANAKQATHQEAIPSFVQYVNDNIEKTKLAYQGRKPLEKLFAVRANSAYIFSPALGCEDLPSGKTRIGVVLLHDFARSPYMMQNLARELSRECALVYGVQLKGHGGSEDVLDEVRFEDWQQQVDNAVKDMKSRVEMTVVIGSGLGGNLAFIHALEHPDDFDALLVTSFSLQECSGRFSSWLYPSARWSAEEEKIASQNNYEDDIMQHFSPPASAQAEAKRAQITSCSLISRGKRIDMPMMIVFGDRNLNISQHVGTPFSQDTKDVQLLFLHNARKKPSENRQLIPYRTVIYDLSTKTGDLALVPDEYLFIPPSNPWYGENSSFFRCWLASNIETKQDFCSEEKINPRLRFRRDQEVFDVYYRSYNPAYGLLIEEIVSFVNKFYDKK